MSLIYGIDSRTPKLRYDGLAGEIAKSEGQAAEIARRTNFRARAVLTETVPFLPMYLERYGKMAERSS